MLEKDIQKALKQFSELERQRDDIMSEIISMHARVDDMRDIKAYVIDGLPHGTGISDNTYKKAQRAVDEYNVEMDMLLNRLSVLEKQIWTVKHLLFCLSYNELKIIRLHYFEHVGWDLVALRMGLSRRTCMRCRDEAFTKMIEQVGGAAC